MVLSKLHDKCKSCKYKDECNEKRMVACGILELKPNLGEKSNTISQEPIKAEMAVKETSITINMGDNGIINTSLEELRKKIKEDMYKSLRCGFKR